MKEWSKEALAEYLKEDASAFFPVLFDSVDSTNEEAKRRYLAGERRPLLLVANGQTAGRGRMGRSFYSPKESGVYFSLLLPGALAKGTSVSVTAIAAVAVARGIQKVTGVSTQIKWVNDLYYRGKKVCGILAEGITDFESPQTALILGVGINLSTKVYPEELSHIAGGLDATAPRLKLVAQIVRELLPYLNRPSEDWLAEYQNRSMVLGRRITWTEKADVCRGVAKGIEKSGALRVEKEDGTVTFLSSGEISLVEISDSV